MPRIPEYQQGQLASELVGTPGIDTSMGNALRAAAAAEGTKAGAYNQAGVNLSILGSQAAQINASARIAKQKELAKAEKERQRISDQITTTEAQFELSNKLGELHTNLAYENREHPEMVPGLLEEQGRELVDGMAQQYPRQVLQANVTKAGLSTLTGQLTNARTHAATQRTKNDMERTERAGELMVEAAGKLTSLEGLQSVFGQIDQFANASYVVKGDANDAYIAELKKDASEAYLYNMLGSGDEGDPQGVVQTIDSGVFDDVLPAKDRFAFKKKFYDYAEARQKEIDRITHDKLVTGAEGIETDLIEGEANGTNTIQGVDTHIKSLAKAARGAKDPKTRKSLNSSLRSAKSVRDGLIREAKADQKAADKAEVKSKYDSPEGVKFRDALHQFEAYGATKDGRKDITEALVEKQKSTIRKGRELGLIKAGEAASSLKRLAKIGVQVRQEKSGKKNSQNLKGAWDKGIGAIGNFFGGKKATPQQKKMSQEAVARYKWLVDNVGAQAEKAGKPLTDKQKEKLRIQAIQDVSK